MAIYTYTTPDAHKFKGTMHDALFTSTFIESPLSTAILGVDTYLDLENAPHVLIAGTTGSGKSVMLHCIFASLLVRNTPNTAEFLIIDQKRIEFKPFYENSPMLYCPIITDVNEAIVALDKVRKEMDRRYILMEQQRKRKWNEKKLYIIIDELTQLVMCGGKKVQDLIGNIAFLGRAAGIHLIIATQHPSADIINRQITANVPVRVCLKVDKWNESNLILGVSGAEKLKGNGDALLSIGGKIQHFQGAFISDEELEEFSKSYICEEEEPEKVINISTTVKKFLDL